MYADRITDSMRYAISETNRRRVLQTEYNKKNNIDPTPIVKAVTDILSMLRGGETSSTLRKVDVADLAELGPEKIKLLIASLEEEMHEAAKTLDFEEAARLRDEVKHIKKELKEMIGLV